MDRYKQNAKWLQCLAPFRNLPIAAAYLTPFFLEKGLSLPEVLALQSIFSVLVVIGEVPSGYFADRWGRAFSIKLSLPLTALGILGYALSEGFWVFAFWEAVLAVSAVLISGADEALLVDSLKADRSIKAEDYDDIYRKVGQRIDAYGYVSVTVAAPLSFVLVANYGVTSTLIANAALTMVGAFFAWKLVEAPRSNGSDEDKTKAVWRAMKQLAANIEARWLVVLGSTLSAATYVAFWLSAPYFESIGIPAVWLGVILAVRSAAKGALAYFCQQRRHLELNMFIYALLAGLVYIAMASGQLWLALAVLGHDVVQALHKRPVQAALNERMHGDYRATLNSLASLAQRLVYAVAAPLIGLVIAGYSLSAGLMAAGIAASVVSIAALLRLRCFGTFSSRLPERS